MEIPGKSDKLSKTIFFHVVRKPPALNIGDEFARDGANEALRKDFPLAEMILEKAIALDPARSNHHVTLGNVLLADGQIDRAVHYFSAARSLDSGDLTARLGLITVALITGDTASLKQMIADFARLAHVDITETLYLSAAVRADILDLTAMQESLGVNPTWGYDKLQAICHFINRYFPFGSGLDALIRRLPHLSINNLVAALFDMQNEDLTAWAAEPSAKIAFVNSQPKNVYNDYPIFASILSKGHRAAYFLAQPASSTELVNAFMPLDHTYIIAGDNLSNCGFDLLFSTSPQAAHLTTTAANVLIPHDIAGHPRASRDDEQSIEPASDLLHFDYFLTTNERMADDLFSFLRENDQMLQANGPSTNNSRKRSARRLVPSGYAKLDYNIDQIGSFKDPNRSNAILIYPTDFTIPPGVITPFLATRVIELVLERFPDHMVIYRPHPNNNLKNSPEIAALNEALQTHPRYEYNDDPNYLSVWARSSVMLTDYSGGAMTYACTTGKPCLFLNPTDEIPVLANRGGILMFTNELGLTVGNLADVIPALSELLDSGGGWLERISDFQQNAVFHPSGAANYIASIVPTLLKDENSEGWIEF
jgi:hypothetical protein